nr:MAG TPA: YSIRK type signal peptide [Caudoviricetes sp.]
MLETVLTYLPYLGLVIITHTLLGVYHNVEQLGQQFSWRKLLIGVAKAAIVSEAFIALAFILDKLTAQFELKNLDIMPDMLLVGVIAVYAGKCIVKLKDIFTVDDTAIEKTGVYTPPYEAPQDEAEHQLPEDGNGEG